MADDQQLNQLKSKYQSVLNTIQQRGARVRNVHIEGGKLLIRADAPSQEIKNEIWSQIKAVDSSFSDLTADINVDSSLPQPQQAAASGGGRTYTVESGDSLSKISKQFYGNAGDYMKIFNANTDKLSDPDKIRPGQVLTIP